MKRENFNSRLGFILVSAGCAIGIGNVWKFPYVTGANGGGVFVLFYILFLICMGVPVLTMELAVGRASRKSAVLGYKELEKPGRDPRDELPPPLMRSGDVMELKDLKPGLELVGTVRNVVDYGAFVDIGVHEDGLVHISQLADRFVKNPFEVVKVNDVVKVRVLDVDLKRGRISLTMRKK